MRGLRVLLAGMLLALLPAAASAHTAAGHDMRFALRDINCQGLTVTGKDLPARSSVRLALVNTDNGRVVTRRTVLTTAAGRFSARLQGSMNGVLGMRVLVRSGSGATLGYVDHTMTKGAPMCQLPFTGPFRPDLAVAGSLLIAVGALMLLLASRGHNAYWPEHAAPSRRQRKAAAGA
jgi:hypothetical protein